MIFFAHQRSKLIILIALMLGGQSGFSQHPQDSLLIFAGDTVEVISDKATLFSADIAATAFHFDQQQIQNHSTLADLLKTVNGSFVKSYGGSEALQSIGLRGASNAQTLLLVDGVPVNSPQNGGSNLGQISLNGVSAVDVYNGGNSTLFGSGAIGGAINTSVDLQPERMSYHTRLERRSFGVNQVAASLMMPFGITGHRLQIQRTNGDNNYRFELDDKRGRRANSDFHHLSADYVFQANFSKKHQLLFQSLFNRQNAGSPAAVIDINAEQGQARIADQQQLLRLKWQSNWHTRLSSNTQIYDRREWNDYRDPGFLINGRSLKSNHQNRTTGFTSRKMLIVAPDIILQGGIEFNYTTVRSSELAGVETRRQAAGYVLLTWALPAISGWQIKTNSGIRFENYNDFGQVVLPRGGIEVTHRLATLYASLGKNFRSPTFNDLYWNPGGNADLKPETAIAAEAGIRLKGQQFLPWQLNTSIYQSDIKDYIRWVPNGNNIWQPQNIETVRSRGVEVFAKMALLPERLLITATYTNNLVTKSASAVPDDPTIGNRLPYSPRVQYSGNLLATLGKISLSSSWQHVGYRFTTLANIPGQTLSAYSTLTVDARYTLLLGQKALTVYGQYNNLLREAYQLINRYPLPLFSWRLGIELAK